MVAVVELDDASVRITVVEVVCREGFGGRVKLGHGAVFIYIRLGYAHRRHLIAFGLLFVDEKRRIRDAVGQTDRDVLVVCVLAVVD